MNTTASPQPATARPLPTTIPEYLEQLREALRGADPAMVQDALYDAAEYLRSELSEQAGRSEAEVIASVAGSYGAPEEVADIYRETEVTVNRALRPPRPPKRRSLAGRFFGVVADPYTYGSLFYMLLALATGTFYFSWVVTGASLSLGLMILIVGIPLLLLLTNTISTCGWFTTIRNNSPAVYPAPPITPTFTFFITTINYFPKSGLSLFVRSTDCS